MAPGPGLGAEGATTGHTAGEDAAPVVTARTHTAGGFSSRCRDGYRRGGPARLPNKPPDTWGVHEHVLSDDLSHADAHSLDLCTGIATHRHYGLVDDDREASG